jgi:Tol biopolymer transport system component
LDIYSNLSITADGQSLVTAQIHRVAIVYVGDSPATLNDKIDWKLVPISNQQATGYNVSWTPGGKLLQEDETYHVYETAADGTGRVDLLGSDELALDPSSCGPDVVVLTRILDNHKAGVWRLNIVTGELKQLTFGRADQLPSCTPDGRWVVYQGSLATDSVGHILKVSVDGGAPVELARGNVIEPAVSPDGNLVVYMRVDGQAGGYKRAWVVQKLEGGTVVREFPVPATVSATNRLDAWNLLGWTPDGRSFTYVDHTAAKIQNVFMQPLNGDPRVQVTHLNSEPAAVVGYGWSRDGKKFAITRYRYDNSDVVMFSNFK